MVEYNPNAIEKKWQKKWDDEKTFKSEIDNNKKKFYPLVEFHSIRTRPTRRTPSSIYRP